ncbi:MAG: TraB/GumN family protein [Rhodospirillales bacterium]|nr:TraB/GumN family protein [Rhodospirillales bacterium]
MRIIALAAALLAFPSLAFAACEGQDWRAQLAPEAMQEIRDRLSQVPFHRGIAFEAVRGESRLTLFGTVHVHDPGVHVPDDVAARIRSADLVLLETTPEVLSAYAATEQLSSAAAPSTFAVIVGSKTTT